VHYIALQICDALASAHAKGIIHRDLKPANCLRITRGQDQDFIKLLDFGIAKLVGPPGSSLTNTGELLGTAYYMAPEQAMGHKIDHRVDIYALGAMLYQLLTGRVPFDGRNNVEVLAALLTRSPEPIHTLVPGGDIPPEFEDIVERAMQKEAAWRFPSMSAFAEALSRIPVTAAPASEAPASIASAPADAGRLPFDHTEVAPEPPADAPGESGPSPSMTIARTPVELSFPPGPAPTSRVPPQARWTVLLVLMTLGVAVAVLAPRLPFDAAPVEPASPPAESTPPPPTIRSTPSTVAPSSPTTIEQPAVPPAAPPAEPESRPAPDPTPPLPAPAPDAKSTQPIATKPRPKPTPRPKTEKDIKTILDEVSRTIRAGCHSRFGDRMAVRVTVAAATGKLLSRRLLPPHEEGTRTWACITSHLDRAQFPPFAGADYSATINLEITTQP
jgi:serine/threonine protein kinase